MTKVKSKIIKNSDSKQRSNYASSSAYSPPRSAAAASSSETSILNSKKRKLSLNNSSSSSISTTLSSTTSINNNDLDDSDFINEIRNWNLNEKVNDLTSYNAGTQFVQYLDDAKEFTYSNVQQNGFQVPLVFKDKSGLDMRTPSKIFTVNDIKTCVGSKRMIDVIDCMTQKSLQMTMKEWCEYYENTNRERILNVISLEFSHTKLEDYVEAPLIVRQLDWIEQAWPRQLRLAQRDSTNSLDKMKYPKVQKYVLMSVAECYTDFHIDMGGTSVWYHILKGEKIFWLIRPSEKNLDIYQKWILDGTQSEYFLPDLVDQTDCQRIVLQAGETFMLPSGWIHAVYTSKDSIVFGGNFLHSFNIEMQLKIYKIETKTKVPDTYRYPFYLKMLWFLIERYVHCFTGITHLDSSCHLETSSGSSSTKQQIAYKTFDPELVTAKNLTSFELNGLLKLKEFLSNLKNNIAPNEIIDSNLLFSKFKEIIEQKQQQQENISISTVLNEGPFIHWPKMEKKYLKKIQSTLNSSNNSNNSSIRKHIMRNIPRTKGSIKKRLRPQNLPRSNVERRRRVRCHRCEPCTRDDCGECKYCKDMKKFGGTGISKQCCLSKQCLQPLLPTTTTCMACEAIIDRKHENEKNIMYECEICFEIYHVQCFKSKYSYLLANNNSNSNNNIESVINEDLNNCWKCANCVNKGYSKQQQTELINKSESQAIETSMQLTLNTSSNYGSDSLNNSFNSGSNRTNDMFVSPISTDLNASIETLPAATAIQQPKKKRHRRTKLEILNSKSAQQTETINMSKQKKQKQSSSLMLNNNNDSIIKDKKLKMNKKSIISIDSLTSYEKQIILDEFCDMIYDYESSPSSLLLSSDHLTKKELEDLEPGEIISTIDFIEDNSSVDNNYSLSTQNSFAINDDENDDDDDNYIDEQAEHINKENNLKTNKKNESLLKMIQTN